MKKKVFLFISMTFILIIGLLVSCKKAEQKADGPIEIEMWVGAETSNQIQQMMDEFMRRNPNIHVKQSPFAELRDLIRPAINAGEGPDFYTYDTGPGYLGMMVNAGLALDFTSYSEKYGWKNRFQDWALEITTYDGKLYGIANEVEMLGVFYNRKMFADLGITPPSNSYQEFIDICQKILNAGKLPVIIDDRDQWPGFHYESIWMNIFAGPQKVKDAIYRTNNVKWTDPDLVMAMDKFAEFARSKYVNKQINALGYDDANAMFVAGESVMRITGTWMVERFIEGMGDDVGFFYMPPGLPSIPDAPPGGFGGAIVGNAKTKHPDETAAFIDFFFGDYSCPIWYEGGFIPAVRNFDVSNLNISVLLRDIVNEINDADLLGQNIDVVTGPRVNDAAQNYVQQIIDGSMNGAKAMELKQKAHEEDFAAGDK